ncbi:hypothetical protein TTHERM_00616470 (macronuclear) [Tetrahymena thermophila SB210]|uniref:Uncharacterized protein n=1 Tax=Tetrahymena thermophila (strain SB210) TaxID=312017 RepID=I7MMA6_TETTS|nr:hypothetical protein TTHERM_00616470 [Tetrahymena thermophila SB210]EAS04472.2 hypothetical protein TTHERM_00616470 [Tetrahymena thermophila SB210]|eukprot:XP_001024717.2 hypothetical protein TTHERM_00616470 [Tetrahymena thermophila SB210]
MNVEKIQQLEQNLTTHKRLFLQSDEMIQEEPKEFRQVPGDYFDITDTQQIEELTNIIKTNQKNKKQSFQLQGLKSKSESKENVPENIEVEKSFNQKINVLFSALDNCKKEIDNKKSQDIIEQKYLYYTLDDVEYKDKEVISEAFAFLKDLEKKEKLKQKKEQMQNDEQLIEEEFDILSFKPSYQQSSQRTQKQQSQIQVEEQKLKSRIQNLTIEEDEDDEYEEQKEE